MTTLPGEKGDANSPPYGRTRLAAAKPPSREPRPSLACSLTHSMKSIGTVLTSRQNEVEGEIKHREKWIREGYILVPNILTLDREISPQAKMIFLALCVHA